MNEMELLQRPNSIWFWVGLAASDFHGFPATKSDGMTVDELVELDAEVREKLSYHRVGDSIRSGPGVDRDLGLITVNGEVVGWGVICGLTNSYQPVSIHRLQECVRTSRQREIVHRTLEAGYRDAHDRPRRLHELQDAVDLHCFCDIHEGG